MNRLISTFLLSTVPLILSSCSSTHFYCGYSSNISWAISDAIEYKIGTYRIGENFNFPVSIMIANRFYGRKYDGTFGVLIGSEEKPGYGFVNIDVLLKDSKKTTIKDYEVNLDDYNKQENGIEIHKEQITKSDFSLFYDFELNSLLPENYDGKVFFEVAYTMVVNDERDTFGNIYSFDCLKNNNTFKLTNFGFNFLN